MRFDQSNFEIRCEWGLPGLKALAPISDVIVIVDVLSFTTAVDIGTARGGLIYPYPEKGESAADYAKSVGASLAISDRGTGFSLSPASLRTLPAGYRLVLPSLNGGDLSFHADHRAVLAACFRNASAVAAAAASIGRNIAVIPAGETWPGGELRPCLEDQVAAGAIISRLTGRRSPEATLAAAVFDRFRGDLAEVLRESVSGTELIELRFAQDVDLAAELNTSRNVPRLVNRAFVSQ